MNRTALLLAVILGAASVSIPGASAPGDRDDASTELPRPSPDPAPEYVVSVWRTAEGLPVNDIYDLRETADGYLWLGTHHGLVRFDGVRFETFFRTPTGSRYGTRIMPLELDSRGRLWLAPDQVGLICLERGGFTEVLTNEAVLQARAASLCSDGAGGLLWVDEVGRLGRLATDPPRTAEQLAGADSGTARWLRDFQGQIWLAGPRRLRVYESNRLRGVPVPGRATLVAAPRRAGGMWVAREAKLRFVTPNGAVTEVADFPWRGLTRVTCMYEDSHQRLWIGTESRGLFCYASGQFRRVVPTASAVQCFLEDREENLWVGTHGGGLIRLRHRQFFINDLRSGLPNELVLSLAQDPGGNIWMVTGEGGLGWWSGAGGSTWHPLDRADGWTKPESLCVTPARNGGVWVSTSRRGLWRWSNGRIREYDLGPRPPPEPAVDLLEDRQGRLWLVTDSSGIYCLTETNLVAYSQADGLPSRYTRCVIEDGKGEIWVGDWQGGISRLRGKDWELLRKPSSFRDSVRTLLALDGALWIGTDAGGLLRFKDGKTDRVSVEEGLPGNCVMQLLPDGQGSLWGTTPYRLFRVRLDALNEVVDGRQKRVEAITYGRGDGLPDISFAVWHDPRCWRTSDGELWFATANGALHFRPGDLHEGKPPQVLIEQVRLEGKPLSLTALQRLRPGPGRLEFQFTAPCLTAPERIRFRYRLTGVDEDWVDADTTRSATYASVPAGRHTFQVLSSSPDGVWSSRPAIVALSVHPYFWQTNWFLAAVAAAIAGGGVWAIRRATVRRLSRRLERLQQQHAVARERARIAQDIHDELGANLTSIGLLADLGTRHKSDHAALTRDLGQISETARGSVAAMDAIVWALNPRNDSLDHFANYLAQFTRDFFRPTDLRTRLALPANLPEQHLAPDVRHQLFLIVKESFNNVVRHARATEVRLELACEKGHLRLSIADNGQGLPPQAAGAGKDGLANLHERIARLGGTLRVESQPGRGTKLDFTLPLAKAKLN